LFIGGEYCETRGFDVGPFGTRHGSLWSICYNNGVVTSVKAVGPQ
jgi:hypothetical protein